MPFDVFPSGQKIRCNVDLQRSIRLATVEDLQVIRETAAKFPTELGHPTEEAHLSAIHGRRVYFHEQSKSFMRISASKTPLRVIELAVTKDFQGGGLARAFLGLLEPPIELSCRVGIPSNDFYKHLQFKCVGKTVTKSGSWDANIWRYDGLF